MARSNDCPRSREAEIRLLPGDRILRTPIGENLLRVLQEKRIDVDASCGGQGTCGECRVRFVTGAPEPTPSDRALLDEAEVEVGWRLACAHVVNGDADLEVRASLGELDRKACRTERKTEGRNPIVHRRIHSLHGRTVEDRRSLFDRLAGKGASPLILRRLSDSAAQTADSVALIEGPDGVIEIRFDDAPALGLAIDVGTTTLAVHVLDLETGEDLGGAAARNPQRAFGADVISRIAHVRKTPESGLSDLREAVLQGLNGLISRAVDVAGGELDQLYAGIVVGNTTMLHLLLGVDPRGIDTAPYRPAFTGRKRIRAIDLGLSMHPRAIVETLPGVSAYIGADIIAGLLATEQESMHGTTLFLDIGTNGEVILGLDGRLLGCSTAAGPAFEGASIVQGMPALPGAIESVGVHGDRVECSVIGGGDPSGLCGTGLVSAVAELLKAGIIEPSGRLVDPKRPFSDRFEGEGAERRFHLANGEEAVYLYQSDIREYQLAKAAIRAGIETLMRYAKKAPTEIDRVLVAGGFSRSLSPQDLVETGFLPPVGVERIELVGNTAAEGARSVLMDQTLMEGAARLAERVTYIELSGHAEFNDIYVACMQLAAR